ncbi:hypothetical protein BGX30_004420 [Mortierella sp. GBA39]|nr:hypothetical protein BGX30_004420 [Mortierella sp. GBA39]
MLGRFAFFAAFDDPQIAQVPQLVGHRGLAHAEQGGQVMHAQFSLQQRVDQLDPRGITKGFKPIGDLRGSLIIDQRFFDFAQFIV